MALILNIETTTTNCSVSLSAGSEIISLKEDNNKNYSHSESLHLFIEDVLEKADEPLSSIDAIAVSEGPGSYTGLRIGVSAAKGLCYSLDVPLISVSTLHALAYQKQVDNGVIVPMLDARRLEVYSAVFSNSYKIIREVRSQILNENSFSEYLENGEVYFVGNANEKAKMIIQHPNAHFSEFSLPSSQQMALLSAEKFLKGDFENLAYFEPAYLKEFRTNSK